MSPDADQPPLPYWAWAAVGLCGVISLFGSFRIAAIAIGAIGGGACYALARSDRFSDGVKMAGCAAIVVVCWIAFIAYGIAVALMTRSAAAP